VPGDSLQLDYAPPPGGPSRRTARRWLIAALAVVALVAAANWLPDLVTRARLVWIQDRCATFAYPPGAVIYDSDPANRAALLKDASNYVPLDDTTIWLAPAVARREPPPWTNLKSVLFGNRPFWPPGPAAPKALLHSLRNGLGQESIVAIIIAPDVPGRSVPRRWSGTPVVPVNPVDPDAPQPTGKTLGVVAALVRPGDRDNPPAWDGNGTFLHGNFDPTRRLRFFAAQLDPLNPAHFTLPYEMDGQAGTIDGTYQPDGDVVMTIRDGPAKIAQDPATPGQRDGR
jgi:hypothetical protein